jgi:hypothetical protein
MADVSTPLSSQPNFRRPVRAPDPRAPRILNARPTGEVGVSPCEQNDAWQSLAGILVGEKNRCIPTSAPGVDAALFRGRFWGLGRDNFRDNFGLSRVPVTRTLSYT